MIFSTASTDVKRAQYIVGSMDLPGRGGERTWTTREQTALPIMRNLTNS